jgi:signal transduction histidine kinase
VLLVEDNPGDARLIREAFRESGVAAFELRHVDRLASALEEIAREPVDVVLLDLSLPDATGIHTVERMLSHAPDLPIVVLTGLDDERLALQAVQAGAQDYLVKGQVEGIVLTRAVRYALERKRLDREREALLRREQAAVRARDEVLRVVSHDLGNSLSAVGLHATLLERTRDGEGVLEEVRRRGGTIRQLVKQMHRLRQDLLDAASIEAGRLSIQPRPLDPGEAAREAAGALEELVAARSLRFRLELPESLPCVAADRQRVLQVLDNLLGNAVKFTEAGGEVVLSVAAEEDFVCYSVRDTGPGIEPASLVHVFDRFWRGAQNREGAGLGLAIAKGVVEAHGGAIRAESTPGVGSVFSFTLPTTPGEC